MKIKKRYRTLKASDKYKIVTFVGSRNTPAKIIKKYSIVTEVLAEEGVILRSGNAHGFDQVLYNILVENREIYLPHSRFGRPLENSTNVYTPRFDFANYKQAEEIVRELHPNKNLKPTQMRYLARDVYQVLGKDLNTPSDVVFCWTEDGAYTLEQLTTDTGGTAMAIRVAIHYGIPVVNLNAEGTKIQDKDYLEFVSRHNSKKRKEITYDVASSNR